MRTRRLRMKVKKYLAEHGEASTTQIFDYINETMTHGAQMNVLANVLAKDKGIQRTGKMMFVTNGMGGGRYKVEIWELTEHGQEEVQDRV